MDIKDNPNLETIHFSRPTEGDKPNVSRKGMLTKHWKTAKQAQQNQSATGTVLADESDAATGSTSMASEEGSVIPGGFKSSSPAPMEQDFS
jgi:hypothetical protein